MDFAIRKKGGLLPFINRTDEALCSVLLLRGSSKRRPNPARAHRRLRN
jgi:hypothetical protein